MEEKNDNNSRRKRSWKETSAVEEHEKKKIRILNAKELNNIPTPITIPILPKVPTPITQPILPKVPSHFLPKVPIPFPFLPKVTTPILHNVPTPFTIFKIPYPICLLYTSPSPRDRTRSRMPSSA